MILPVREPTFARWLKLSGMQFSLLRSLEYERIEGLRLSGLVLDVGGGIRNSYVHLLQIEDTLESVNIDPTMEPTYLADLNGQLAIPSNRYDNVICFNTLEHISNDRNALRQMCRVLKPGGTAHITAPFVYRVHGAPSDFHRHTAYAWEEMLVEAGFELSSITIEPLAFGRFVSAFALVEFFFPLPLRWILKKLVMLAVVLREMVRRQPQGECDMPLGYYIVARKACAE